MPASRYLLRVLHLSDLHERGGRERSTWRRRRVLGEAWERNLEALQAEHPIDLVCFTGDIADWALAEEYEAASEFFEALLEHLHLGRDRLFFVPGNHDIHRRSNEAAWQQLRHLLPRLSPGALSRWLAGDEAPPGVIEAWREQVLHRQASYRRWLEEGLRLPALLPANSPHGRLGYRASLRLPDHPFDVHILGLDSAWLSGDDSDAGRLYLTDEQVMRLASDERGAALPGFRLALVHHPLEDLADGTHCRRLLAERVDLLLRGHLHETEPALWTDPERSLLQMPVGCLYDGHGHDQFPNSCQVLTLALDGAGRPQTVDVWFRCWTPRGFWSNDTGLYRDAHDGRLRLALRNPQAETPAQAARSRVHSQRLSLDSPGEWRGTVLGSYTLQEVIGQGGTGVVFRAWDPRLGREACIKIFYPLSAHDGIITASLMRMVRGLASLSHPHLIRILDFAPMEWVAGHSFYIVMELVEGHTLLDWSERIDKAEDCFRQRLRVARLLANALHAAHTCRYIDETGFERIGLLHGDIKPENVMVRGKADPVLIDFMMLDLQRLMDDDKRNALLAPRFRLTDQSMSSLFGTEGYMAPEQKQQGIVTVRSDVYGLGVTLHRLFHPGVDGHIFSGWRWEESSSKAAFKAQNPALSALLHAMTDPDPRGRPWDMEEVERRLSEIAAAV